MIPLLAISFRTNTHERAKDFRLQSWAEAKEQFCYLYSAMRWILPAHTSSLQNGFILMEPAHSRKVSVLLPLCPNVSLHL